MLVAAFAGGDGPLQAKPPKPAPNEDHPHSRDVLAQRPCASRTGIAIATVKKTCATVRVLTNVPKAKTLAWRERRLRHGHRTYSPRTSVVEADPSDRGRKPGIDTLARAVARVRGNVAEGEIPGAGAGRHRRWRGAPQLVSLA